MGLELLYTSARRGLRAGTRGYCTVAFTEGMPANCVELAESLSGYRNVFLPQDKNYALNPPAFSHYQFIVGGERTAILSRVCSCDVEEGRTNLLAHHVFVGYSEMTDAGPAWAMSQSQFFKTQWNEEPHLIKGMKRLPGGQPAGFRADAWERLGDAGWAGALAQSVTETLPPNSYIIFNPGIDLLPLVVEAMNLVPPERRWSVTFNTYFSRLPQGTTCLWRFCLPDSEALKDLRRSRDALCIDLTQALGRTSISGPLVDNARTGAAPAWPSAPRQIVWIEDAPAAESAMAPNRDAPVPPHEVLRLRSDAAAFRQRGDGVHRPAPGIFPYPGNPPRRNKLWPVVVAAVVMLCLTTVLFALRPQRTNRLITQQPISNPGGKLSPPPSVERAAVPADKSEASSVPERDIETTAQPSATNVDQPETPPVPSGPAIRLAVVTNLLASESVKEWEIPVTFGEGWTNLNVEFFTCNGEKVAPQRARQPSFATEITFVTYAPLDCDVDVTVRSGKMDILRNTENKILRLGWMFIGAAADKRPSQLLVFCPVAVKATVADSPSGYRAHGKELSSVLDVLPVESLKCRLHYAAELVCDMPRFSLMEDGLGLNFEMPRDKKEEQEEAVRKALESEAAAKWQASAPVDALAIFKGLRERFTKHPDEVRRARRDLRDIIDLYEKILAGNKDFGEPASNGSIIDWQLDKLASAMREELTKSNRAKTLTPPQCQDLNELAKNRTLFFDKVLRNGEGTPPPDNPFLLYREDLSAMLGVVQHKNKNGKDEFAINDGAPVEALAKLSYKEAFKPSEKTSAELLPRIAEFFSTGNVAGCGCVLELNLSAEQKDKP